MSTVVFLFSSSVNAREWYIQPRTTLRTEIDDNLRLSPIEKEDVAGFRASFFSEYGTRTETSNIDFTTLVDVYEYWGQDNLDRVDFDFTVGSDFQITERNTVGLNGLFVMDTTITSEEDLTGLTQVQSDREKFNISPHWAYQISDIQAIQLAYTHEEVEYEGASISLTSYETDSVYLNYTHQWTEDLQQFASFTALQYRLSDFDVETDDYSITSGFDYRYSETLKFNALVGVRISENRSNIKGISSEDTTVGSLFGFGVEKQFELSRIDLSFERSVNPSGRGEFLQADRFKSNISHSLTKHLEFNVLAAITRSTSTDEDRDSGRTYYSVEPKLSWRFSRQASLSGGYRYRMQEFDSRSDEAVSNGIFMTINYQWDKFSTNRF
ncbi:MAG: hypothetical protein ACKE51_09050 [Methylococcaceae bacterium]